MKILEGVDPRLVLVLGFVFGILVYTLISGGDIRLRHHVAKLIEDCEENIPRSVTCKIIAVPEVSGE